VLELVIGIAVVLAVLLVVSVTFLAPRRRRPPPPVPRGDVVPGVGDDAETLASLRELADHGAALAIDDFGVGFSSVGYLQHMPVDILKIDRSFTADIDTDERADALVRSMVLMGNALGLRVVAEGIERPGQLERVCRTGCAAGQGYLFSPPRPLKEIVALLEAEHNEQSWLKDIMLAAAPTG